jgi:hypothetical protein
MPLKINIMKKSHVDNVILYLVGTDPVKLPNTVLTMNSARKLFGCQCLSQTVTKANKRLAGTGVYIENIKNDGGYAIYKAKKII